MGVSLCFCVNVRVCMDRCMCACTCVRMESQKGHNYAFIDIIDVY